MTENFDILLHRFGFTCSSSLLFRFGFRTVIVVVVSSKSRVVVVFWIRFGIRCIFGLGTEKAQGEMSCWKFFMFIVFLVCSYFFIDFDLEFWREKWKRCF